MKRLVQEINTKTDAFSYTVMGETEPLYVVDCHGYLTSKGKDLGKFNLFDDRWCLHLDSTGLYMTDNKSFMLGLPEFELKALTALANEPSL